MKPSRVDLVIITPHVDQLHHTPRGMIYVDGMLEEARLTDRLSPETEEINWLTGCLKALKRLYGRRVRVRLVNPMTLTGLYLTIRYRIRQYPSVIMPDGRVYFQPSAEEISQVVANLFQQSQ